MGKIYIVIADSACEASNLSEAKKLAKYGMIMVPKNEDNLTIDGGKLREAPHVVKKQ